MPDRFNLSSLQFRWFNFIITVFTSKMAAINILNLAVVNNVWNWPENATFTLIRNRRRYHGQFEDRTVRDHTQIWQRIANNIYQRDNFLVSQQQCRNKWRALQRGYENLRRLFNGNPNRYPTHSPNTYDTRFYTELSDEFWERTSNYLSSTLNLSCLTRAKITI